MTLLVTQATTLDDLKIAMAVRFEVFINEQGFNPAIEKDEYDDKDTTIHFIGKDVEEDKYVAVARCLLDISNRKAKFGRVAVLSECRGKGYGVVLMEAMEKQVAAKVEGVKFVLSAQYDKKVFYEKCGYKCTSDEIYLEEGVKHCWMEKSSADLKN